MWFNNALVYSFQLTETVNDLSALLAEERLKPCPPHARFIYGWLPVIGDQYAHEIADFAMIALGKEERLLPRGVIQRLLDERVEKIESERGYPVKRAEKASIAEELEFELLPKAFCLQKRLLAGFDFKNQRLILNTSSTSQANQLLALLRKTIPGLRIEPLQFNDVLALKFAQWMTHPTSLPSHIQLASDCVLIDLEDEKKRFNCKGYELPAQEINQLIAEGLSTAEISFHWHERIHVTLTQQFTLKRLRCLDYLVDEFKELKSLEGAEQQDAAMVLFAGEIRALIDDLLKILDYASTKEVTSAPMEVTA